MAETKIPLIYGVPQEEFYKTLTAPKVYVAELRPGLEGMTEVARSLIKNNIEPVVICDNMLAFCMEKGLVSGVHIFGQGKNPAVCRTGSLIAAICAKYHQIPVVFHPGKEGKKASSLLAIGGKRVSVSKIKTYVPLEEDVPSEFIS